MMVGDGVIVGSGVAVEGLVGVMVGMFVGVFTDMGVCVGKKTAVGVGVQVGVRVGKNMDVFVLLNTAGDSGFRDFTMGKALRCAII
jgi:hypothetical protein